MPHTPFEAPSAPPVHWRLLDTEPAPGAWNMGVDEALAASVRAGGDPVLRFYRWRPACLSLGRNQPARGCYREDALAAHRVDVVRRPTGGRAVLHRRELTYSAAVAEGALGTQRHAYATINRALVAGLARLGVAAAVQGSSAVRAPPPSLSPCFADPVEGEVVAGGRKLVGSAQRVLDGVLLQHGSLPIHDDQPLLAELLVSPPADDVAPAAALACLLGREPEWAELTAALAAGFAEVLGAAPRASALTADEEARAREAAERYASPAWTWHQ